MFYGKIFLFFPKRFWLEIQFSNNVFLLMASSFVFNLYTVMIPILLLISLDHEVDFHFCAHLWHSIVIW